MRDDRTEDLRDEGLTPATPPNIVVPLQQSSPAKLCLQQQKNDANSQSLQDTVHDSGPVLKQACPIASQVLTEEPELFRTLSSPLGEHTVMIEICAGSAILSLHMQAKGLHVIPIDYVRNTHRPFVPIVVLDLADDVQCGIVLSLIRSGYVSLSSLGVPCGTCSAARDISLKNGRGPVPLRSKEFPMGLPGLSQINQERVAKANAVYMNAARIINEALLHGGLVIIENPLNSLLWSIPFYHRLLSRNFIDVTFQHCKWNGDSVPSRKKWTCLRTNVFGLKALEGPCKRSHLHLPWGVKSDGQFATAEEAEYPAGMCEEIATICAAELRARGYNLIPKSLDPDLSVSSPHKRRRAVVGKQPRGRQLPPLISEFSEIKTVTAQELLDAKGQFKELKHRLSTGGDPSSVSTSVTVGVFRSPEAYLQEAKLAKHPCDLQGAIPDEISEAIVRMLSSSPSDYIKGLLYSLREITKLVHDNTQQDKACIDAMNPLRARVMGKKKLASLKMLLDRVGYVDQHLIRDMSEGFHITGMQPFTKVFDFQVSLPNTTTTALRLNSMVNNDAMLSRCKTSGNSIIDDSLWKDTLEECRKGWLFGPFETAQKLADFISSLPHLARRFPLQQGPKIRPIDDLSEPGTNGTFGCHDRMTFLDVDSICAVISRLEHMLCNGLNSVSLRCGQILSFQVHRDWVSIPLAKAWKGKTFDLHKAYKQFTVHDQDLWESPFVTFDSGHPSLRGLGWGFGIQ